MNLEDVWQAYRVSIKAFLHSKLNNPDDVDDILQDVLIKFYNNISTLKDHKNVKSWLFQIANNTVIDFYRKQGKLNQAQKIEPWFDTDELSIKQELSHCITPFLATMDESQASLLKTIDLEGKSQKMYAQEHNISYSTVKSRVQVARANLKAQFDACCDFKIDKFGNLVSFDEKSKNCQRC